MSASLGPDPHMDDPSLGASVPGGFDELVADAAVGELDADGQARLDAILADHPTLTGEFAAALTAAAAVQHAAAWRIADGLLPAGMRARVLAEVAATPQEPLAAATSIHPPSVSSLNEPISLAEHRARRSRLLTWSGAAAAAAMLVVGSIAFFGRSNGDGDGGEMAARVDEVLGADDMTSRTLGGELTGTLSVAYSAEAGAVAVMGDDLAALPKDVTLQLWFVDDAGAMPVGTFQPDEAGHVAICFDAIDPRPYVLGVTMEPMGGSDTPTMPILASA
jgi:hypothetical protein